MDRTCRWFTVWLILLMGCSPVSTSSPQPSVAVEATVSPSISPLGPTSMPSPSAGATAVPPSPTAGPTATPAASPTPPTWELRVQVTTSSDWTTVRLVEGVVVDDYAIISASQEADTADFDQSLFQLTQPIERANNRQSVEMVVDLSLASELGASDLILEIDRGHIGQTTVEIHHYRCGRPSQVAALTWDGIQPSGENVERFAVPAARLAESAPNEYIVIAQLNFWYYGAGLWGGFENDYGERSTPLTPLLGYTYEAADPDVVYQQIEWAVEYGVDAFSIEWTTPRGVGCCGSMEDTLDDVFLKSPNIDQVRWAIFYDFPLRLMQTTGLEQYADDFDFDEPRVRNTLVYDFGRFARKYFGHPQYLTIDGRPVIYIWATNAFQGDLEGALREARLAVAEEGYDVFIAGDEVMADRFDRHHASLFDANTTFTFLIPGLNPFSWSDIGDAIPEVDRTFERWRANIAGLQVIDREELVNFQPAWAPQYDERLGRPDSPNPFYVPAVGKEQVIAMAEMARRHAEPVGSQGQMLIWVNTWNCWGETTTIEPTADLGPKYPAGNYHFDMLEVVREVFGGETFTCSDP